MIDLTDSAIDAALAACELTKPDNGNSGAPAVIADSEMHEPEDADIDRLIDELIAFAHTRNARTPMEQNA
jgi:hypothetical protein